MAISVSDQIIAVIDALCSKFGVAVDWTEENILPYIETLMGKYITWEIASSWLWVALCGVGLIGFLALLVVSIVKYAKCDWDDLSLGFGIFSGFLIVICAVGIIDNVFDIIKCRTFPELQIIEYINKLISSTK